MNDGSLALFRRRAVLLGLLQAGGLAALGGRLYQLQVSEAEQFHLAAEDNRISLQPLIPARGLILDRFHQPLADNRPVYRLVTTPLYVPNLEKRLRELIQQGFLTRHEVEIALDRLHQQRRFQPLILKENLNWEELARIEVRTPELAGFRVESALQRGYPIAAAAAHVVGYVGMPAPEDVKQNPVLKVPDMRTGKKGLEKRDESTLLGQPGQRQVEVMVNGRPVRELSVTSAVAGSVTTTSIDRDLQRFLYDRLGDQSGSAVVMDIHTGEVLALVSAPSFDPHDFINGIPSRTWKGLLDDPRSPLMNKPLQAMYPPASTFKLITALAALRHGVIGPRDTVFCPGVFRLGSARYHCWKRGGHGAMHMQAAIAHSCDVYFYEVTRRMGIQALADTARDMGLGHLTGIELAGEKPGIVPDPAWKQARFRQPWHPGETVIAGIGQGYMLVTPLQMALMTARIASGRAVVPTLSRRSLHEITLPPALPFSDTSLKIVRQAMWDVVNAPWGTALGSKPHKMFGVMAGKTGTAQVRRISAAERARGIRRPEDMPWHLRDHAMFVAYMPYDSPRYAISVVVEHGIGGSKAAAPIARDVLREMHRRYFG
jgi:penicillin-binding protein 2